MNWISVKDRLPDTNMDVLAFDGEYVLQNVYFSYDQFEDNNSIPCSNFPECITHWMPLPDKPAEDNLQLDKDDGLICPRYTGFNCLPDKPAEEG